MLSGINLVVYGLQIRMKYICLDYKELLNQARFRVNKWCHKGHAEFNFELLRA